MNQPGDRPVVPMKGQPATAKPSAANPQPTPPLATSRPVTQTSQVVSPRPLPQRGFVARLKSRARRNPSFAAFAIIAVLAVVLGTASLFGGEAAVPEVGESEASPTPETASLTPTTIGSGSQASNPPNKPNGEFDVEATALSSVVSIDIYSDDELCSGGTGSAVLDGNYVITNLHVVEDTPEYDCYVDEIVVRYLERVDDSPVDGFTGEVVVTDQAADLAVLRLRRFTSNSKVLTPVAVSSAASVNDDLFIVGFPSIGGDSVTFSRGIVSGFIQEDGVRWIKTDAQISGGNSGGPAFNSKGELVGVPTRASASASNKVVDCRIVEDTNGDGRVNDRDACVPIGGSFTLLSPASAVQRLLDRVNP